MHPLMLPRVKKDIYDMIDDDKINKIEKTDTKPIISENGESKCKIFSLVIFFIKFIHLFFFLS